MYIVLARSKMTVGESAKSVNARLKLVCGVNDNGKRCHTERLLGLPHRVCLSPPCLQGSLITSPYNYLPTKASVKVPVK